MFIAVCGFDKMIGIYDFFSGELIAQTSGHSELVTSVKFSPDGQYLVSIGGDSCIMMWKLSSVLVQAMQERLIELFSNAQKKNTKVVLRQSLTIEKSITKDDEQVGKASKDNKWAQRAEGGAYELFGRKIDPASNASNKNKFTLELTHAIVKDEVVVAAEIAEPVASERLAGGIAAVGNNFNNTAATIEALDNVNISELSDDDEDDDGNKLFKDGLDVLNLSTSKKDDDDDIYEPDFEREDRNTEDADLLHASTQVDKLEKTAQDLESWLETMVFDVIIRILLCI